MIDFKSNLQVETESYAVLMLVGAICFLLPELLVDLLKIPHVCRMPMVFLLRVIGVIVFFAGGYCLFAFGKYRPISNAVGALMVIGVMVFFKLKVCGWPNE